MRRQEREDATEKVLKKILERNSKLDFLDLLLITTEIVSEIEDYGDAAYNHIDDICNKIYKSYPKYFKENKQEPKQENEPCSCKCGTPSKPICECQSKKANTYVAESETEKTIKILVPGVHKNNIVLSVKDNLLSMKLIDIVIEQPFVNPDMSFEYALDDTCDIEKIKSSLDDGILTIVVPKIEKKDTTKVIKIQ